ncbi:hypothetical protein H1R20_g5710, partial [Candolleomyces eurysporus]
MLNRTLKNVVLPLVLFPALTALAFKYSLARVPTTSLALKLKDECASQSSSPYALSYTGHLKVDGVLCRLVTFFHTTMDDDLGLQFLAYFIGTGAILALLPGIEASRSRKNPLLAFPLLWLLASQVFTLGATMTVYALVFILTGAHRKGTKEQKEITQAYAESLIFALLVGAVAPSLCLVILKDPQVTALWQIYPVFMSVAGGIHLLIRSPSKVAGSGWTSIQVLLLGIFMLSSSLHFSTVWPIINEPATIQQLLIPSIAPLPSSASPALAALDFLQWDYVFAFVSLMFVSFWFAQSVIQFFALLVWYIVMTPVAGPGAALAGVFLWREAQLH